MVWINTSSSSPRSEYFTPKIKVITLYYQIVIRQTLWVSAYIAARNWPRKSQSCGRMKLASVNFEVKTYFCGCNDRRVPDGRKTIDFLFRKDNQKGSIFPQSRPASETVREFCRRLFRANTRKPKNELNRVVLLVVHWYHSR